jgi:hypothetical protein
MHDVRIVSGRQTVQDLCDHAEQPLEWHGIAAPEHLTQALAFEQLHDHERHGRAVIPEIEQAHHVAVIDGRRDARFSQEDLHDFVAASRFDDVHELDGDGSREDRIVRTKDLAHATGPDEVIEPVAPTDEIA